MTAQDPAVAPGRLDTAARRLGKRRQSGGTAGARQDRTTDPPCARLVALYEQGLSNREIGDQLGVCADVVGQLLRRHEIPVMPLSTGRRLQAVRGREEEIVAAFLRLRSDAAVAREVGLQVRQVRRVVDANVPEARALRRARRSSSQTYADQELIEALREAARELPSPLAIESYRRWSHSRSNGHPCPGPEVDHPEVRWLATGTRQSGPAQQRTPRSTRGLRLRHGRAGHRCRLAGDAAVPERRALRRLACRTLAVPRRSDRQRFRPKLGRPSSRCLSAGLCARRAPRARNDCLAQPLGLRGTPRFGADRPCPIGSGKGAADFSHS